MREIALWLDTTLPGLSMVLVALKNERWEILASFHEDKTGATSKINKVFSDLISQSGISVAEINHLLMGVGPGSFTGIKIGMAWAFGFSAGFDRAQVTAQNSSSAREDFAARQIQGGTESPKSHLPLGSSHRDYSLAVDSKAFRMAGLSSLELAAQAIADQPINILLKVTSAHGFLLRTDRGEFAPDTPREIAVKIEDLPHTLNQGKIHLACPWPEVSGILSDCGREVIEHNSLRLMVEKGLLRFLNQKNFQWRNEFPFPRYLKLSTAEEKLKLTEKGE